RITGAISCSFAKKDCPVQTTVLYRYRIIAWPRVEGQADGVNAHKSAVRARAGQRKCSGGGPLDNNGHAQTVADGEIGAGHRRTEKAIDGRGCGGGAVRKGWPEVGGSQHLSLAWVLSHIDKPEQHEPAGEVDKENTFEEIGIGAAAGSTHRERVMTAASA